MTATRPQPSREPDGSTTARVPKLAHDLRRLWIATGAGFVASIGCSAGYAFVTAGAGAEHQRWTALLISTLGLVITLFGLYQVLTWRVFARLDGARLRELARATTPRSRTDRWYHLLSGNGPKSWSVAASGTALLAVLLVIVDEDLRRSPYAIAASTLTIALGWTMIVVTFTITDLRDDADRLDQLDFPGRDADNPPVWKDYVYLAVQVSTTFSSSDVTVRTTRMRSKITTHSIVAFIFNTVIIALVVSAITIIVG